MVFHAGQHPYVGEESGRRAAAAVYENGGSLWEFNWPRARQSQSRNYQRNRGTTSIQPRAHPFCSLDFGAPFTRVRPNPLARRRPSRTPILLASSSWLPPAPSVLNSPLPPGSRDHGSSLPFAQTNAHSAHKWKTDWLIVVITDQPPLIRYPTPAHPTGPQRVSCFAIRDATMVVTVVVLVVHRYERGLARRSTLLDERETPSELAEGRKHR